ncbi:hypothetical protein CEP51_002727 [Fusarium floridanum]|uniref:Uncharacterized protein n=1 Tax=Fusarium floridanum TaxID=1325733 RepID=A0A428S9R0_9HYPO|nr:hypothetical protein CEP51_002727 [Fusarium floridanum]
MTKGLDAAHEPRLSRILLMTIVSLAPAVSVSGTGAALTWFFIPSTIIITLEHAEWHQHPTEQLKWPPGKGMMHLRKEGTGVLFHPTLLEHLYTSATEGTVAAIQEPLHKSQDISMPILMALTSSR